MIQSNSLHAAVIMDGNGRWAQGRGLLRGAGHLAGARAVEEVVAAAPREGISTLTLFAFSSDNWRRPMPEVTGLLRLFGSYPGPIELFAQYQQPDLASLYRRAHPAELEFGFGRQPG